MFRTANRRNPEPLASFKAGLLHAVPQNDGYQITPDLRRGLLSLEHKDGANHLIWKDRISQQVVEDLLVFPGDQEFSKISTGNSADRVLLLEFKTTTPVKRMFFWMQEPVDRDFERIADINALMNQPPPATEITPRQRSRRGGGSTAATAAAAASSSTNASTSASNNAVGFDELTEILMGLGYNDPQAGAEVPATTSAQPMETEEESTNKEPEEKKEKEASSLVSILSGQVLEKLLRENPGARNEMIALLPEGQQTEEDLYRTLKCPQLRQSLIQLTRALRDEVGFSTVMAGLNLELKGEALHKLQSGDEVGAFIAALEQEAKEKKEQE